MIVRKYIRKLIEKYFNDELYHARKCAYHDAKKSELFTYSDTAIARYKKENQQLTDLVKKLIKFNEELTLDTYEANPWTIVESKIAKKAKNNAKVPLYQKIKEQCEKN